MKKIIKERSDFLIALCAIGFFLFQAFIIAGETLHLSMFNGVFMACQYGLCLIILSLNQKRGIKIAFALMAISLFMLLRAQFIIKEGNPLPGIFNAIFYIITLLLLNRQFRIREREALTDMLTGLLSMRGLTKVISKCIKIGQPFSLLYIELENFKNLNDNHGHICGDKILLEVTDRLKKQLNSSSYIARINGAEFVVVLPSDANVSQVSASLLAAIREKIVIEIEGNYIECYLTPYAGTASFPDEGTNSESIIQKAGIALVKAVKKKSETVVLFDSYMEAELARELELERLIKESLKNDYFYLVYQPQYHIEGKKLRGFEALLRMSTPNDMLVGPSEFIPVAEARSLILSIDNYVIKRALTEFKETVTTTNPDLVLSINVSAKNICDVAFVDRIKKALDEANYPANNLEIEITEYCLVEEVETAIENIKKLSSIGVRFALDDFGTGYTSLSYLAKMPINLLKIDKSLIDDIAVNEKSLEFVHAVISMGHMMGCEVISEGVEDEKQLALLGSNECDLIQGYVWSKPLSYQDALELTK